jgi:hypothetical protein
MIQSSNLERNTIVLNESFSTYMITLGLVQSAIVDTFHIGTGILGVIYYWPYFFLSVYMAKKFPLKGLFGTVLCIMALQINMGCNVLAPRSQFDYYSY